MQKQKLTLDPKCTAVREAVLTVFDEKPLGGDIRQSEGFEVVECGKISEEQTKEHRAMVAFAATDKTDVGIIDIECVSVICKRKYFASGVWDGLQFPGSKLF